MSPAPAPRIESLRDRQAHLVEANARSLGQVLELLERIDDAAFSQSPMGFAPHKVGGHLRHCLEFYQCFLDGLDAGHVDYDARTRDESLEARRSKAAARIREIIERLRTHREIPGDPVIWVRMEDSAGQGKQHAWLVSSVARELQFLASHTIHHMALMAMTLRAHGFRVDPTFGMAPSTLRNLEKRLEAGAHTEAA